MTLRALQLFGGESLCEIYYANEQRMLRDEDLGNVHETRQRCCGFEVPSVRCRATLPTADELTDFIRNDRKTCETE